MRCRQRPLVARRCPPSACGRVSCIVPCLCITLHEATNAKDLPDTAKCGCGVGLLFLRISGRLYRPLLLAVYFSGLPPRMFCCLPVVFVHRGPRQILICGVSVAQGVVLYKGCARRRTSLSVSVGFVYCAGYYPASILHFLSRHFYLERFFRSHFCVRFAFLFAYIKKSCTFAACTKLEQRRCHNLKKAGESWLFSCHYSTFD